MWNAIKTIAKYMEYLPILIDAIRESRQIMEPVVREIMELRAELERAKQELRDLHDDFPELPNP
jgi:archaellum component FlaC